MWKTYGQNQRKKHTKSLPPTLKQNPLLELKFYNLNKALLLVASFHSNLQRLRAILTQFDSSNLNSIKHELPVCDSEDHLKDSHSNLFVYALWP